MTAYPRVVALVLLALLAGCSGELHYESRPMPKSPLMLGWSAINDSVSIHAGRTIWIPAYPIPAVGDSFGGNGWTGRIIGSDDSLVTFRIHMRTP